eukprot:TRINITY_DN6691_c0_g2_i3.p1 TRINITY_DN6691_c0_g2~~TRINITY_DN6691_c0_g2_i3.p1  ORF type:complete len:796 (-),score=190.70 TRINITY_DN6691_c0_g2_i3:76-2247(-)
MDSGHYNSYIKERIPLRGTECKWFEFNDTVVKPWNPSRLRDDCFGGEERTRWGGGTSGKGAYLLFYQRKVPSLKLQSLPVEGLESRRSYRHKSTRLQGEIDDLEKETDNDSPQSRPKQELLFSKSQNNSSGSKRHRHKKGKEDKETEKGKERDKKKKEDTGKATDLPTITPKSQEHSNHADNVTVSEEGDTQNDEFCTSVTTTTTPLDVITTTFPNDELLELPNYQKGLNDYSNMAVGEGEKKNLRTESSLEDADFVPLVSLDGNCLTDVADMKILRDYKEKLCSPTKVIHRNVQKVRKVPGKVPVPPEILQKVIRQNFQFNIHQYLFDPEFFKFVFHLSTLYNPREPEKEGYSPARHMIQFALKFYLHIYTHTRNRTELSNWEQRLADCFSKNEDAARWFLASLLDQRMIKGLLVRWPDSRVRLSFAKFVDQSIICLAEEETSLYPDTVHKLASEGVISKPMIGDSYVLCYIEFVLNLLKSDQEIKKKKQSEVYHCFSTFSSTCPQAVSYLLDHHVMDTIKKLCTDIRGMEKQPIYTPAYRVSSNHVAPLITTIATVICALQSGETVPPTATFPQKKQLPGNDNMLTFLFEENFFLDIIAAQVNMQAVNKIVVHLAWEQKGNSEFWFDLFEREVTARTLFDPNLPLLNLFEALISVEDKLEQWRIEKGIAVILKIFKNLKALESGLRPLGIWLKKVGNKNPTFKEKLFKQNSKFLQACNLEK